MSSPTTMHKPSSKAIHFFFKSHSLYSVPKRMPDRELSKEVFVKGTNKEMNTISVFLGVCDFVMS